MDTGVRKANQDGFRYEIDGASATIKSYDTTRVQEVSLTEVVTISSLDARSCIIHKLGPSAFRETSITAIRISQQVREIDNECFLGADQLATVIFLGPHASLIRIGVRAFVWTQLSRVTLPPSLETIDDEAFAYCYRLNAVDFDPDSHLTKIGARAFLDTAITSLNIPKSVTYIGEYAFSCPELKGVTFEPGSTFSFIVDPKNFPPVEGGEEKERLSALLKAAFRRLM
jgi:hypothetical protein